MQKKMDLYRFRVQRNNKFLRYIGIYVLVALFFTFQSMAENPDNLSHPGIVKTEMNPEQNRKTIHGTIVDNQGEAIIGANIVEKGTTNGTVSDFDGNFSLTVSSDATIVITYISFLSQEVSVAGRNNFNITIMFI